MVFPAEKIFLLSRRWRHHSEHSGYDLFTRYLGRPLVASPIPDSLLPDRIFGRCTRKMTGYDRTGLALELLAARHMATHRQCLYHVLFGDNCYQYMGYLNGWRGHHIVATFHHPPEKFAKWVKATESLKRLSAIIIVGRNQYGSFEGILPRERVFFVPHPVDTSFFVPPHDFSQREENLCLFVGIHLRDFATLRSVIEGAQRLAPDLKFMIVAHPLSLDELRGVSGNFTVHSNLSERDLLWLYQKSTLLIQPLHDSTANNTMLEAMSCGLPIIVSDVGAVRDYVNEDCARLMPPSDPDAMLQAVLDLLKSSEERRRMSIHARRQALTFDWPIVVRQMEQVYAKVSCFAR